MKIFGICGQSGTGKSTIIKQLCSTYHLYEIKETTDRPVRSSDDLQNYNFVSPDVFDEKIINDEFVTFSSFEVNHPQHYFRYGVDKKSIPQNEVCVIQCNWDSLEKLHKYFGDDFISIQIIRDDKQKLLSILERNDNVYEVCDRFIRDVNRYEQLETDYVCFNNDSIAKCCSFIYDIILDEFRGVDVL